MHILGHILVGSVISPANMGLSNCHLLIFSKGLSSRDYVPDFTACFRHAFMRLPHLPAFDVARFLPRIARFSEKLITF